jgi:putative transposase
MNPPREKIHRLPRESYRGEVTVAFTACVTGDDRLFTDSRVVGAFVELLRLACRDHRCCVLIYCFMPDHVHVMLSGQDNSADTWQTMVEFKQRSGWWLRQHRPGAHWQKDFYDHIVRREQDLGAQARYIAANPVRNGLAADWRQYPHTGAIGIELETVISGAITL